MKRVAAVIKAAIDNYPLINWSRQPYAIFDKKKTERKGEERDKER